MADFGFETTGEEVVRHFPQAVQGKIIVITGGSVSGLGAGAALSLAHGHPSHVILLARSAGKVNPVIEDIKKIDSNVTCAFVPIELDSLPSIHRAAEKINGLVERIDILINNAGIMAVPYKKNDAGIESQLATNHIGHFYFTKLLLPKLLVAGTGARIVNVSSDGFKISPFRFDDYNFSDGKTYDRWSGYGQSKTANILFTKGLAKRLSSKGILAFTLHPGVITSTNLSGTLTMDDFYEIGPISEKNTGIAMQMVKPKSAEQGCSTTVVAAIDPRLENKSGSYLDNCQVANVRDYAASIENAEKLWKLSEELIGEKFEI